MLSAALGRLRRLAAVRSWAVWELPGWLSGFVVAVVLVYAASIAAAASRLPLRAHDLLAFGVLLAFCVATTELTRRSGEPAGLFRDMHAVWCLPAALLLPPLYGLVAAIPIQILSQIRVRGTLAYRRVYSAAAVGMSYGVASVLFHAGARPAGASVNADPAAALRWLLLAAACGAVQIVLNRALVIVAVKGSEPDASLRALAGDREVAYNDAAALCLAVVIAFPVARIPLAIWFALPFAALLQRSRRHAELTSQIRIDGKTGLLNAPTWQREAHTEITRAVRSGSPLAVAMIDIDHFKQVNDTHGHLAGDAVLAALAAAMRGLLRDYDLVGRFGGEEFIALLPHTSQEEAREIAERLRAKLAEIITPVTIGTGRSQLRVTVSIGLATLHAARRDLTELIAAADVALYQAKKAGRDQVCVLSG